MRPIDADALLQRAIPLGWSTPKWVSDIMIDDAPTIDAAPVVRCKDCKHRDAENGVCEGRGWPMQLVPDDGFCDKGERREE